MGQALRRSMSPTITRLQTWRRGAVAGDEDSLSEYRLVTRLQSFGQGNSGYDWRSLGIYEVVAAGYEAVNWACGWLLALRINPSRTQPTKRDYPARLPRTLSMTGNCGNRITAPIVLGPDSRTGTLGLSGPSGGSWGIRSKVNAIPV